MGLQAEGVFDVRRKEDKANTCDVAVDVQPADDMCQERFLQLE